MRETFKRLFVAAVAAAVLCPALASAQVSYTPNDFTNRQTQSGDMLVNGDLNVQVVEDDLTSTRTATGTGYSAGVASGSLNVDSEQFTDGNITADQTAHIRDYAGNVTALSAATGNTGEANSLNFGDVQANVTQAVGVRQILATTNIDAPDAEITNANVTSQAIGNSHDFNMVGGAHDITATQSSSAVTQAGAQAQFRYSSGTTNFGATATSNNITAVGTQGAQPTYQFQQSMDGDRTQASVLVGAANAQELNGSATAVANNISISNEYNPLAATINQNNAGYVRAEADVNAYEFGAASSNAYGVGNSAVMGNNAADASLDNSQTNSGEVNALARFNGNDGYDSYGSAVAMGNAVTGYVCSDCGGSIGARNYQSNSNAISASSNMNIPGRSRNVISTASAIGNSATFYSSQPGS